MKRSPSVATGFTVTLACRAALLAWAGWFVFTGIALGSTENAAPFELRDSALFSLGQSRRPSAFSLLSRQFGSFSAPKLFSAPRQTRTWVRGYGSWVTVDQFGGADNMDLEVMAYGLSLGIDRQIGRDWLVGAAFGADGARMKSKDDLWDKSKLSATFGSLYSRLSVRRFYFDIEGGLGYNDQDYPKNKDLQWHFHGEVGTWWEEGLMQFRPYLGLRYVGLEYGSKNLDKTTLFAGLQCRWTSTGLFAVHHPRFFAGLMHEAGGRHLLSTGTFSDSPTVIALPDQRIAGTRFFAGGGCTSDFGRSLSLSLRYSAEIASNHASHTLLLGMFWNY